VLPRLASLDVFHKVVKSQSLLAKQTEGKQAGKFITVYMRPHVPHRNQLITDLGELLARERRAGHIEPCPRIPRSRPYGHVFIETPLDEEGFIFGGSICDPTE
jgi:hypothetical protein